MQVPVLVGTCPLEVYLARVTRDLLAPMNDLLSVEGRYPSSSSRARLQQLTRLILIERGGKGGCAVKRGESFLDQ